MTSTSAFFERFDRHAHGKGLKAAATHYCAGCGHGLAHKPHPVLGENGSLGNEAGISGPVLQHRTGSPDERKLPDMTFHRRREHARERPGRAMTQQSSTFHGRPVANERLARVAKNCPQISQVDWEEIIQACDMDGDGAIDFQDFITERIFAVNDFNLTF